MLGAGITVKVEPLLGTPPTVTTTGPVVAPAGTEVIMLVALQFKIAAIVPLNITVLEPTEAPKFVPVMVICAPTAPVVWLRFVMVGPVPPLPVPALKAARIDPQVSDPARLAEADVSPALVCIWSSLISLVFGSAGTKSLIVYPAPAV
jgi:hypothetical protein